MLKLTDAAGRQLAFNDDHEDKGAGLTTHHADSWLRATLPADGTYYLHLGDTQHKGGPEYAYRLRISPPRPDFELRVVPSSINVRAGATVPLTVYALRKDGFAGEIALALEGRAGGLRARAAAGCRPTRTRCGSRSRVPPTPRRNPSACTWKAGRRSQGREVVPPGRAGRGHDAGLRLPPPGARPGVGGRRGRARFFAQPRAESSATGPPESPPAERPRCGWRFAGFVPLDNFKLAA